jgi:hypothetical protein
MLTLVSDVITPSFKARTRGECVAVIDTETATLWGEVFDFGIVIVNSKGTEVARYDAIVKEVFENVTAMKKAFYFNKVDSFYQPNIRCKRMTLKSWRTICVEVSALCAKHRVSVVSAYNLAFDRRVIAATNKKYNGFSMFPKGTKELCLWKFACHTELQSDEFEELAVKMGWVSEAGNLRTNAEVAYKFMTGNLSFSESHTALDDALIELDLLKLLMAKHKELPFGVGGATWQLVNKDKDKVKARKAV